MLIRWWTKSPYSHCEVIIDGLMFSAHPREGGTRFAAIPNMSPDDWDILYVPTGPTEDRMLLDFCHAELGCKYDWFGIIFSQIIRLQREHKSKWFCSEVCAAVIQRLGLMRNAKPCTFSPGKLHKRLREAGASSCGLW